MNIDQKFIENYLTLKDDDPVLFRLYPWQQAMIDKAIKMHEEGKVMGFPSITWQRGNRYHLTLELARQMRAAGINVITKADLEKDKANNFVSSITVITDELKAKGLSPDDNDPTYEAFLSSPVKMSKTEKLVYYITTAGEDEA